MNTFEESIINPDTLNSTGYTMTEGAFYDEKRCCFHVNIATLTGFCFETQFYAFQGEEEGFTDFVCEQIKLEETIFNVRFIGLSIKDDEPINESNEAYYSKLLTNVVDFLLVNILASMSLNGNLSDEDKTFYL